MKEVINLQGEKEMVNIDTAVKTVNGIHYLLTQEEVDLKAAEESAVIANRLATMPKQLRKATAKTIITVDGVEYQCDADTSMAILGLVRMLEELNDPTYTVQYKGVNGFHERTLGQLKVAGLQVGSYQNKAFATEKITSEEVANGTITTEEQLQTRFNELMV